MNKPKANVLDLGANIGTFALPASAKGHHVIAVEASAHNVDLLQASVSENNFHNMQVIHAAVTDKIGQVEFVELGPYGGVSTELWGIPPNSVVSALTVDALLQNLNIQSVDFIKMDIEGSEVAALRGMKQCLSKPDAPPLFYESNGHTLAMFGESPQSLMAAVTDYGYQSYIALPGRLIPVRLTDLQFACVVDYLAVKRLPEAWKKWLSPPMTHEETLATIVAECGAPGEPNRAYCARVLADAGTDILSNSKIIAALQRLMNDTAPSVRKSASWFKAAQ